MRIAKYIVLFFLTVLLGESYAQTAKANTVNIGAIYALTGEASYWGTFGLNGLRLAIEEGNAQGGVNGEPIELLVQDSQTQPANAVSAYQWLTKVQGARVICGDIWNFLIASFMPLAGRDGVLHLASLTAPVTQSPETFFSVGTKSSSITNALNVFFENNKDIKRAAIFAWDDDWGKGYLEQWKTASKKYNVEIIYQNLNPNNFSYDYRADVAKAINKKPDLVFISHHAQIIIKLFAEQKYFPKFLSTNNITEIWYRKLLDSKLLDGVYYTDWPPEGNFVTAYQKRFGDYPLFSAGDNYDMGKLIVAALKNNKTNPASFIQNYKGPSVTGSLDFTTSHWGNYSEASLMKVINGKLTNVSLDLNSNK
ncbi:MAG: ABC transporter substrate-binding protein [Deltaproteobacteria bacterium]|nr:ABC transporter substrate-binding protein [Deltaproteobacteria bacterium]